METQNIRSRNYVKKDKTMENRMHLIAEESKICKRE
jgi:hypothetical protein